MNRLAKWLYSVGFFLAMCGLLAAGTYQYKDNLSIPYNINLFTCGSASCTSMVLQNSAGAELFNGANPGAVLATIQNILVSPISVGISGGSSPVNVTMASPLNVTGSLSSAPVAIQAVNVASLQGINLASPQTYGVAPVGSVEGVNAFVTNNVNVTPPTPLQVTLPASPVSVGLSGSPVSVGIAGPTPLNVTLGTPLNVTVGNVASPQGVAVVNNVAVTTPTPLQVTLPASPLSVGIAGPSPLQVTLPATPISVGIAGPTPLNVTIATGTNITQIAGNNIASPTGYGTAPVGSVQGVNAFVTNNVNVTTPTPLQVTLPASPVSVGISSTPLNVTVGNFVSPQGVAVVNNVAVTTPTPLQVTFPASPISVGLSGSPVSVGIAGPTPLNVTVGGIVSPQGVTIAGPTPLQITLPASPISVGIAGPTPLSVAVTPAVQAISVANAPSAVSAYVATSAYAVTGSVVALGATPGIVGVHQLANVWCSAATPVATPPTAYLQIYDATPHATGTDVNLTTGLANLVLAVAGSPVQSTIPLGQPPPGMQFNHGIAIAFTQGALKSSTAVGVTLNCSFAYN